MTAPQAGATRFAHLLRGAAPAALATGLSASGAKADDDEDMKEKGPQDEGAESEGDDAKADDGEEDGKKAKKAKKGKKKDESDDDEEDDGEDSEDDGDDEGDSEEMRAAGPIRSARMRERGRCAAIFADAAAARNPALAAEIAFGTDLPRSQALNVLRAGGAAAGSRLGERMATVPSPRVGPDALPQAKGPAALAAKIVNAYEEARGLKRKGG